ncbi:helix-turn-helix domain-containing protein [Luteolibacter sp. AS25]|uniref:helix-turn-helix domain-containing protein n=1 Tax=Luteolibacter sp. AS25 TaxID=3135776 RepID=UPI00398AEF16
MAISGAVLILELDGSSITNGGMKTMGLGEKIRDLRKKKGISLRELARRVGISPSFLSELETAQGYPSTAVLERLAGELGVAATEIRKLDMRSKLSELRSLLENDPGWGPVFEELARVGRSGKISPENILLRLKKK